MKGYTEVIEYLFKNGNSIYQFNGTLWAEAQFARRVNEKIPLDVDCIMYCSMYAKRSIYKRYNLETILNNPKLVEIY